MLTATSKDGTRIAFWRSGQGPPLLLVHGATADHTTTWRFVRPQFEQHFTVYAMDRRGRGGSGDASSYDLQREAEDVAAVVDAIGEPVNVLGHSYGALCAIEAALLTPHVRTLILYEGVPRRGAKISNPEVTQRMEAMLEAGDTEGVLIAMYRDLVEMPPHEIEMLRSQQDAWAVRLGNVPTLPRELKALEHYTFVPSRFKEVKAPTLLLVGEESPPHESEDAEAVAAALPNAHSRVLAGEQHAAMYTNPVIFVEEIMGFLAE